MRNSLPKISEREKDIMSVLWLAGESLTASAIAEKGNGLSINTVQAGVRNLLKKNYIEVAEIVYSNTVLTRSYRPIISAEQYAADRLQAMRKSTLHFSTLSFIDHLLKADDSNILDDLEDIIRKKKEEEEDN
jgi:predicted transcriptional regulator